jgi:hypothetical protein
MSLAPPATLFKKDFEQQEPTSWMDIYTLEYQDDDDLPLSVTETTITQYHKLNNTKKFRKFIMANSHWGILVLNEDREVILLHTIRCRTVM